MTRTLVVPRRLGRALASVAILAAATSFALPGSVPAASAATDLVGTFRLTSGSCAGGKVSGTYLRMILPSGGANGPYMSNSDSPCSDQTVTPLRAGSDGGLFGGSYQPTPVPAFDSAGNARAGRVTAPAQYYGTGFATATNPVDPQTRTKVPAPRVVANGSRLSADLRAFSVSWNKQYFNQGSPKPNGSYPGNTRAATGTYNASTGAFTLDWTSQVVGGPFDKFTGKWHLEGVFVPAAGSASSGGSTAGGTGGVGGTAAGGSSTTSGGAAAAGQGGGAAAPGAAPSDGAPGAVASPGTAGNATTTAAPVTRIETTKGWQASPWLLGVTIGIAVLGFGTLVALQLLGRKPKEVSA